MDLGEKMTTTKKLPKSHTEYTDKYFIRSKKILEAEGINPQVSMRVFARGEGNVVGLEDTVEILREYSDLENGSGEIWTTSQKRYATKDPLIIVKGPIQSFIELETMYLGVLSNALSKNAGHELSNPEVIKEKFRRLSEIYGDVPITYFGARHYHWSLDKQIAKAAIEGGAVQASTDIGAKCIGKEGVGTIPHALVLSVASKYGKDVATLKTAQLFDKHMPQEIPRVTLVDTFNRELTDSLMVTDYFGERKNAFRIDTCGENIGEGGSLYGGRKIKDPSYKVGTGVTLELAKNLRMRLIQEGFADSTDIFLTSRMGDEKKARAFVKTNDMFRKQTGYSLFSGVGIGEASKGVFCTADIFEINGKPFSKVGREVYEIDYTKMRRVL